MLDMIAYLSKLFLKENVGTVVFEEFTVDHGDFFTENVYPSQAVGRIKYSINSATYLSRRLRVQYYQCRTEDPCRPMISSMFSNEVIFYDQIWPLGANEATHDLLPKLVGAVTSLSVTMCVGALMFEYPTTLRPWDHFNAFNNNHLHMMARRLGRFHGRVLETQAQNAEELTTKVNALTNMVSLPNAAQAVEMLQHGVNMLEADVQFKQNPKSEDGISRLRQLVAEFPTRLHTLPVAEPSFVTLCHQNYSQKACFFGYYGAQLDELKVAYWGTVGRTSLVDDLIPLLFVDTAPQTQTSTLVALLLEYVEGVRETCATEDLVPLQSKIWDEIKNRIPLLFYHLARRVMQWDGIPILFDPAQTVYPWHYPFVLDLYKMLILNDII